MSRLRVAFMGTPGFSVPALDAIQRAGHEVVAVYTPTPPPAPRGKNPTPPGRAEGGGENENDRGPA
ncbi:MAG: hypothetical protein P1V34_04155, partial [Alphaproteobacteria bacterium]|nr:hypothetical protein [Alphaproteobacteria bacterium]